MQRDYHGANERKSEQQLFDRMHGIADATHSLNEAFLTRPYFNNHSRNWHINQIILILCRRQ